MDIFKSRYFFTACIISIVFSTLAFFISPIFKLIIVLLAIIASMVSLLFYVKNKDSKGRVIVAVMFCIAIVISSFSSFIFYDVSYTGNRTIIDEEVEIEGVIIDEQYSKSNLSGFTILIEKINGEKKSFLALYECAYISDVRPGDRIKAKVIATDFESSLYGYAEKQSRLADGYIMSFESLSEEDYEIIDTDVKNIRVILNKLNFKLSYKLRDTIGGEAGNLSAALLLGNREYLSENTIRDFKRSGASHFLALSGLHMSIIMGTMAFILKSLFVPKKIRAGLLIILSVFYLSLTGFSVSATRSVLMLLLVYVSMLLSYESEPLTNLSFVGAIMLVVSPTTVLDVGFWMSFSATFGILVFLPIFEELLEKIDSKSRIMRLVKKIIAYVAGLVVTTVAAMNGLILVVCIFSNEYSVYSIVSSLVLSLPMTGLILFSMLLPCASIYTPLETCLVKAIRLCGNFALDYCESISLKKNVVFSLDYDFLIFFAIAFAIVLFISLAFKFKRKYLMLLTYIPIIAAFILTVHVFNIVNADKVDLTYINSSSNSDIILISNDGDTVICDFSNGSRKAYSSALAIAQNNRSVEIEAVMLSDYHKAHISTLSRLFKANIVRQLWLPTPADEDAYYTMTAIIDVAKENKVEVKLFDPEEKMRVFSAVSMTLYQSYIERSAVPVSIFTVECNDESITYFSPAYTECEENKRFIDIINDSDYLIAGARGPKVKNFYSLDFDNSVCEIVIPNEDIAKYFEAENLSDKSLIWFNTKIKSFVFNKESNKNE